MLRFILYFILFYILFRLIRSIIKIFSNSNRDTNQVKTPRSKRSKFEDVEDAKYIEIKPDDEKRN